MLKVLHITTIRKFNQFPLTDQVFKEGTYFTDSNGHDHYCLDGKLVTLEQRTDNNKQWCEPCGEEHEQKWLVCKKCEEIITKRPETEKVTIWEDGKTDVYLDMQIMTDEELPFHLIKTTSIDLSCLDSRLEGEAYITNISSKNLEEGLWSLQTTVIKGPYLLRETTVLPGW